jgi:hypothetical protein
MKAGTQRADANPPRAVYYALTSNIAVAACKYCAAAFTNSGSALAETIHSSADCLNQLLLTGNRAARGRADEKHPLGFGRETYFYAMLVALQIFLIGGVASTRASAPWASADGVHYPGTYVAGRTVENEDLVNFPNWLAIQLRIGTDDWFDPRAVEILSYSQEFDLLRGMLFRSTTFRDTNGRTSTLKERRLVSMCDMHLSVVELTLVAEDWSADVTVRSSIDARVVNRGAVLYRTFNNRHLEPLGGESVGPDGMMLEVRTSQSHLHLAQAALTRIRVDGTLIETSRRVIAEPGYMGPRRYPSA